MEIDLGLALSAKISTCIDITRRIESLIKRFKDARSELRQDVQSVGCTRRLLLQLQKISESSFFPRNRDLVKKCSDDIRLLWTELEDINQFLISYFPLCSRKGLAGLAWRYRWGKEIGIHLNNLAQLNAQLKHTLENLRFKVGFLALGAAHIGSTQILPSSPVVLCFHRASEKISVKEPEAYHPYGVDRPAMEPTPPPAKSYHQTLREVSEQGAKATLSIGRAYLEAAQEFRSNELQETPSSQIQQVYLKAAKAFQVEEWGADFRSTRYAGKVM